MVKVVGSGIREPSDCVILFRLRGRGGCVWSIDDQPENADYANNASPACKVGRRVGTENLKVRRIKESLHFPLFHN
jgi:hypothetical protein